MRVTAGPRSVSPGQTWDPARYARHARFVSDLAAFVVEMLAPHPGERILDLGCGDGPLTERIAAAGALVLGVDASTEQIGAARARGLGVGWVSILDPAAIGEALETPPDWALVAYLCVGYPVEEHPDPELERYGWQPREAGCRRVLER